MSEFENLKNWKEMYGFKESKDPIKIYYDPVAYAKTVALVQAHSMEVAWNMTIKPYEDGYRVNDIFVYPQSVNPAHVSVDVHRAWAFWKDSLGYEIEKNLYGQGHSHVDFSVFKSVVDENQQRGDVISTGRGFYFFQIWNKKGEIASYFYDIDNKIYYENIEMIVEEVDSFVQESFTKVYGDRAFPMEVGEGF